MSSVALKFSTFRCDSLATLSCIVTVSPVGAGFEGVKTPQKLSFSLSGARGHVIHYSDPETRNANLEQRGCDYSWFYGTPALL
jgi:hypothetical protein